MEDKELKKRLKKIPDTDKNGEPVYKILDTANPKDSSDKHDSPHHDKVKNDKETGKARPS